MKMIVLCVAATLSLALADDDESKRLPEGAGKDVVIKVCNECHGVENLRKMRLSREEWQDKVGDMMDRGAQAAETEVEAIVSYLDTHFGKDSKVWINTAPLGELKSVVGLSVDECKALIAYREANGSLKQWGDLLKVPGVDAKKLEAKKEIIAF